MTPSQLLGLVLERLRGLEKRLKGRIDTLDDRIDQVAEFKAEPGPQGVPGQQGEQGEQGPQGVQGERGERGLIGLPGVDGRDGKDGRDGLDGRDGQDGQPGQKGDRGEQGPRGPQGVGMRGPRGEDGKDGQDGQDGEMPKHQVRDGRIRFETAPGRYGKWISLQNVVTNVSGVANPQVFKTWIDYATGFSTDPVLLETIAEGDVYQYNYEGGGTLYRLIGTDEDAFYRSFDGGTDTVSDLVTTKQMTL